MGEKMVVDINEIIVDMIRNPEIQVINIKYTENFKWGMRNRREWKEKYGGKTVLILNKRVIFADEDVEKVGKRLSSFFEPLLKSQIVSLYIPRKDEFLLPG